MRLMRILILLSVTLVAFAQNSVKSPDGAIELAISADNGALTYTVSFHGKPVVTRSALGLDIQDQQNLGPAVRILRSRPGSVDETYSMPHGKANPIRNVAKTLAVDVEETR